MFEAVKKRDWAVVLGCVIVIYLLLNFVLPLLPQSFINTYLARPALWGALAFVVYQMPEHKAFGKLRLRRLLTGAGLTVAGFQVAIMVFAGLIEGFGKSPYAFTLSGVVINVIYVSAALLGMELSRAWLVNRFAARRPVLTIAWVALFYTLFLFPFSKLTGLHTGQEITRFAGVTLLPSLAESALATFLAFLGGPLPAIAYRGVLQAFQWFCPLLPDLYWTSQALLGTIVPAVGFLMVHRLYLGEVRQLKARGKKKDNPVGWIAVSIFSVLLIWFSLGLLSFYPSVIISGSMRPAIEVGDMIILKKIKPEEVKVGDVIQFWRDEKTQVTHRVLEVVKDSSTPYFITKGDANNVVDNPVPFQNVRGKVVARIPKAGWASLALKALISGGRGLPGGND